MSSSMTDHDSSNTFFNNQLYWWNKMSLSMIGRWPYQNRKWRMIILCLIISPIFCGDLGEVIYLMEEFGDVDVMLKCLLILTISYSVYVLVINSIVNFDMMKEILENMMDNWIHLKDRDEMDIFLRHAMEGKFSILLYFGLMVVGTSIYALQPFISKLFYMLRPTNESHSMKPILDVQFYIDPSEYYVPIYIHGVLASMFAVIIIFALDAYFIMTIYHACGMYDVLGYRIEMIVQNNSKTCKSFSSDNREKLIFERIVECIRYHHDCIRFSGSIEKISNISWLMLITSIVFTLSVTSVQTIIKVDELEEMFSFGLCAVCTAARLFYISLAGQKIIDHSLQIQQFIYNISWYELPPKATRLLIPMLLRASRPSDITAGKLMPLNLHTFCSLMKVSTSYFTFILSTL